MYNILRGPNSDPPWGNYLDTPHLATLSPDKILPLLWNKNFLTETYRNIQTFAFKVLQECISWASRNVLHHFCKCFFRTPNRKMFAGQFIKWKKFLVILREHIIFSVIEAEVEVHKMNEVFRAKLYCKMSDLFR